MGGQQEFVHIFDVPTDEAAKQKLLGFLDEVDSRIKGFQGVSLMGKNVNSTTEFRQASQQMTEALEKITALEKQLQDLREQGARKNKPINDENLRSTVQERLERQKNIQSIKDEIKMNEAAEGSLNQKRLQLKALQQQYDALSASQKKSAEGQALHSNLQAKDKEVKGEEFDSGRFGRNVGNYTGALHTLEVALTEAKAKMDQLTQAGQANSAQGEKLQQEVSMLNTLVGQQTKGFTSLTMEVRAGERALQTLRAAGMEGSESFEKLRMEVAASAREMREFQQSQKLLESEAPVLKSMTIAAKGLGGIYATGAGAAALFADGNEKVEKELNKLVAVMTVLQGLNEIHELLEKKNAIATIFSTAATKIKNFVMTGSTEGLKKNAVANLENAASEEVLATATTATAGAMKVLRFALMATGIGALLILLPLVVEGMSRVSDSMKDTATDQKALEDVNSKMIDSYAKERTELDLNIAQLKDEKISRQEKTKIIADLQEKYPDYLKNIKNEGELTGDLSTAITTKLIPALELEAKAKAAQELAGEKYKEMLELENKNIYETAGFWTKAKLSMGQYFSLGSVTASAMGDAFKDRKADIKEIQDQIDALFKVSLQADEGLSKLGKGSSNTDAAKPDFTDYEEGFKALREEFHKFRQEAFGVDVDAYTKELQALLEKYQEGFVKINDVRDKDLQKIAENEKKGILTIAQAGAQRVKVQHDTALARGQVEEAYYANLNALQDKHRTDIAAKQKEQQAKDLKDAVESQQRIAKTLAGNADAHFREQVTIAKNNVSGDPSVKNKKALADAERDEQLRSQTKLLQEGKITQAEFDSDAQATQGDHTKKIMAIYAEQFDKYAGYAKTALNTVDNLEKAAHERKIARIQQEMDASNKLRDTELQNIQASSMSASQKAAETTMINARNAAATKALQAEENKEKRKQAEMDRIKAVFDISISTARAIMEAVAASPTTGGLPFSAIAAAMGGAELAAVLKAPLPQYEVGTDFHPGGPMVVHPGELRIDPSGQMSMTPDKPTVTMGARGTKIIPADEVNQMLFNHIMSGTARMIERESQVEQKLDELKDAIRLGSQAQVNAFQRQKAPVIHVHNDAAFQAYIDKAVRN
jgi:hypothetical protein